MQAAASELATLVEAEARLDRELAAARDEAGAIDRAARTRIAEASAAVVATIDTERARMVAAIESETASRLAASAATAEADIARFDAVEGARARDIATSIVTQLVARVRGEMPT